ncbi:transposase [Rhodobacteraceae bacterium IMCC15231]|nr:transposase [Rhodobacteraceae bacterium IMCC15231]
MFFSWRSVVYAKNVKTIFPDIRVDSGRPRENGYNESFNGRFRDELLNGEIFCSLSDAQITFKQWRKHFNTKETSQRIGV